IVVCPSSPLADFDQYRTGVNIFLSLGRSMLLQPVPALARSRSELRVQLFSFLEKSAYRD
ncbi:hypothetical protein, partial [Escherichia coli]|uniref:hypothetical protein n=1 Tax=Escherichia coli TaxID=562 RepID=UPI001BFD0A46